MRVFFPFFPRGVGVFPPPLDPPSDLHTLSDRVVCCDGVAFFVRTGLARLLASLFAMRFPFWRFHFLDGHARIETSYVPQSLSLCILG